MPNIEIAHRTEAGFALVMQAESPATQEEQHRLIADWPEVREASVVFQTNEV
jgi:nitrate reductase NapAB chaperone NapD